MEDDVEALLAEQLAYYRASQARASERELATRLAELGWSAEVRETSTPLLVGTARLRTKR